MKTYGGKADSLLKLKENKINVPEFFIIDEEDYYKFLNYNDLVEKIKLLFKEKKYKEIKKLILNGNFNYDLTSKIKKEYKKLNCNEVSIRSSASNEDGKNKSFAGQYNTYLNIKENEIEENIKKCWCSLYENNIIEYEEKPNIFGMNVIVQKMIKADFAGVAFSIDPTDDKNNYSVIEIVKGLGENLVSGKKTPSKFLVRRQTLNIDLKIGNIKIQDKIITNLEKIILEIEKIYNYSTDIEYAIKDDEIYILQARPISKLTKSIKPYSLSITRPHSIIEQEIYFNGEYEGIKDLTNGLYYFKPLFIYNPKYETVEIYYNYVDLEEDPRLMYREIDNNYDEFIKKYKNLIKNIKTVKEELNNKNIDINKIKQLLISIYPFTSLGQIAGHFDDITKRVKDIFIEFRNNYDSFIHETGLILEEKIKETLDDEYKDYISYITLEEIIDKKIPSVEELKQRKKGYIYFGKLYVINNYKVWLESNKISLMDEEDNVKNLQGQIAYSKTVSGRVCKIFSEKDFNKFKEGDILVTPMTVPKFIEVIKKAKGIITDEGGITCHASIVARELQIPCVVGCKNATKILNDEDIVEIDGSTGIIKIKK